MSKWNANGTKVRFYREETTAGSHRFYLNEKGYAIFWRQGQGKQTRFYGFEGTDPKIIKQLKAVFEEEWAKAKSPNAINNKKKSKRKK